MSFSEEQQEVMDRLGKATREVVPRFFKTMPKAYFQSHDREARIAHLKAIVAAQAAGIDQELTIRSQDGQRFTVISHPPN